MFVTMNRIFVSPEYASKFEARFRNRIHAVDEMRGFIRNLVLRPRELEQPYVVMSFWQSEDDFRNWVNSDAFKQGHARSGTLSKEAFSKPSHLETYEAFLDTKASVEQ